MLLGDARPVRIRHEEGNLLTAALGLEINSMPAPGTLTAAAANFPLDVASQAMRVTLMGREGDQAVLLDDLSPAEVAWIASSLPRLNTSRLEFFSFNVVVHGLCGHYRGEHRLWAPAEAAGQPVYDVLPQGDREPLLRAWIDSAANLLMELPTAREREAEGRPAVGFAWPWGEGSAVLLEPASLRRGFPIQVVTNSIDFFGLARLAKDAAKFSDGPPGPGSGGPPVLTAWEDEAVDLPQLAEFDRTWSAVAYAQAEPGVQDTAFVFIDPQEGTIGFKAFPTGRRGSLEFLEMFNDSSLAWAMPTEWLRSCLEPDAPQG